MNTNIITNLGYQDAPAAIRFLVEAFGFAEHAVYEGRSEGSIGHADLRWPDGGGVSVHSAQPDGSSVADLTARTAARGGYPGFSIHVNISDPDKLFQRAVGAGARVVREVQDSPQGTRGFVVSDPERLYWSFGTPLPPLARDDHGEWRPADASPS
jgi:uncharacterized glyoxalase superfamily protein PhnB